MTSASRRPKSTIVPPRSTSARWWRRHFSAALLTVVAVALALRVGVCAQLSRNPAVVFPLAVTDMATYRSLALAIRAGNWPEVFDYQPFYYTVFLPFAYCFSPNGGAWPVMLLQALVGAATVWLTGAAAARLFGRRAGLLAASLLALSRFHVFYTPFLLLEVWFAFWSALVLYCTIRLVGARISPVSSAAGRRCLARLGWHALLGFACAGAMLTRGNALLWLPGIVMLLCWRGRHAWRALLLQLAVFAVCFALPILPYCIHNSRATGQFQGASVAGGKVLALGNSPEAPAGGLEYPRTYYHWCLDAERGHMSIPAHILRWACEKPLAFLELKSRALLLFWDAREIPNNVNFEIQGRDSSLLQLPILLPWGVLGTLGLVGLLLNLPRRNAGHLALAWMMLAFWAATSAFYLLARFRIGFLPLLCAAGGGGVLLVFRSLRNCRGRRLPLNRQSQLAVTVLVVILSCYVVNFASPLYQTFIEPAVQRRLNPNGLNLVFPRELVLYDHGPLSTITSLIEVSTRGLVLTKRFFLPDDFRALLAEEDVDRMVRQRLMLQIQGAGKMPSACLIYNGTRLTVQPTIQLHRGTRWLVFDFEAPLPSAGTQAIFQFDLGPSATMPKFSFGLDALRDYGRTSLRAPGVQEQTLSAEAVVEWVIPRRFSPVPVSDR